MIKHFPPRNCINTSHVSLQTSGTLGAVIVVINAGSRATGACDIWLILHINNVYLFRWTWLTFAELNRYVRPALVTSGVYGLAVLM